MSQARYAAALDVGILRDQLDDLAHARPRALFHMTASGHVVVAMENPSYACPANLDFSDFVVQRCARESRQRRVPAEQAEIFPRGILRRQVRRGCLGIVCRSTLPLPRLLWIATPPRPPP